MNKHFTVAVLGAGGRGFQYSKIFNEREEFSIVSACDYNPAQLKKMKQDIQMIKRPICAIRSNGTKRLPKAVSE